MKQYLYITVSLLSLMLLSSCASSGATKTPVISTGSNAYPAPVATPATAAWAGRGYTGKLLLILFSKTGNVLSELNLENGEAKILFQAPENSWLAGAAYSPDGQQILLTYGPPPPTGKPQFGYSDLYLMPASGDSPPKPFLRRQYDQESDFSTPPGHQTANRSITHTFTASTPTATSRRSKMTSNRRL